MKFKRKSSKTLSLKQSVIYGILLTTITMLAGIALLSCFVENGRINLSAAKYITYAIVILSIWEGICVSEKIANKPKVLIGLIHCTCIFTIFCIINLVCFEGAFIQMGGIILCILAGTGCAYVSLLATKKSKHKLKNR